MKQNVGKLIGSINIYEQSVAVKFDMPEDDINRRAFLSIVATHERLYKELRWLATLPDDQIEIWDNYVYQLQQAQFPEPFSNGLYGTLLKPPQSDERDKDVA